MDYKCSSPFEFTLPTKIVYGCGVLKQLPDEIRLAGGSKILVITDPGLVKAGICGQVTDLLDEAGLTYTLFDGIEANPKDVNAEDGARAARQIDADCLVAVGGGSPIDCAKAIGVLLAHDAEFIKPYEGKTAATLQGPLDLAISCKCRHFKLFRKQFDLFI